MRKYALNLADDGRILSATYEEYATEGMPIVEGLPEGNIIDYLFIDGEFIYEPLPVEELEYIPTEAEQLRADIDYLAIMTGVEL